ncbi:6-phosphogluconolactonase [Salininema proteolyticum]|uniref:6-phosphogluconolactonase n=1 Tax=Salininema proteolyticum TaxID=1607685 RepID=A0ABV8U0Y2_9ACTN
MNADRSVVVHPDATNLATATAARLINRLADAQADRKPAHVALTGGRVAADVYRHILDSRFRDTVDWGAVHFWWGDERFLPTGNKDRNETQAHEAFLDELRVDREHLHPMPSADTVDTVEESASVYAAELDAAGHGRGLPGFDLVLLGVGEDGHVASLFPGQESLKASDRTAVGVHDSPKPPSERTTLTFAALNSAEEVWVIASGAGKAEAVAAALEGGDVPAAEVRGRRHTRWLVDADAASELQKFEF